MLKHALVAFVVGAITVTTAFLAPTPAEAKVNVYTTPGRHVVDGREWNTTCAPYDERITRCRAEIKSGGKWLFNNLTYLASDRIDWYDNPLARPGKFTSSGREWITSCNDDWTGKNGCRSFIKVNGKWTFNNLVYFTPGDVNYPKFAFNQKTGELTATDTSITRFWLLEDTPLFSGYEGNASKGTVRKGTGVTVTQREIGDRSEIYHNGIFSFVPTYALSREAVEPPPAPEDEGTLNKGSSSGLDKVNDNTKKVVRHVWANYPQIKTMYGWSQRTTPDHPAGRAVDIMIPNWKNNKALGWEMARFYRANAAQFGISYIIYDQQIWSVARDGQGWRSMADRGSNTANHKDHLHVNTYDV